MRNFSRLKFNRMKKIATFLFAVIISVSAFSQTFYENYQDGKIWFRVSSNFPFSQVNNNFDTPLETLPFLFSMQKKYGITKLSRPFFALKNEDNLQRTFRVDFENIHMVEQFVAELEATGYLDYAEKVPLDKIDLTPNDPSYGTQWHLAKIQADLAWNVSTGSSSIIVATVDNAVDINHTDLTGSKWVNSGEIPNNNVDDDSNGYIDDVNGYDVADNDNNPTPPSSSFSHGTHVAGITGATSNNSTGIASIGYGIRIMGVKATKNSGSATSITDGYTGITYAAAAGAHVINMSWGGSSYSATAQSVINGAYNAGAICVAAAGNNSDIEPHYPSAYDHVISVGNTTSSDAKSSSSSYGGWVDVSAPGSSIYSTYPFNTYNTISGTSMASPLVAGLVGLMLSHNPNLNMADVENCLYSTCDPVTGSNSQWMGAGRINAFKAMNCVTSSKTAKPNVDFYADVTTSCNGDVNFTDLTLNYPNAWSWNFGDGNTSTQQHPSHTYASNGTYNVTLTATNTNGNASVTKNAYINVSMANPPSTTNDTVCPNNSATLLASGAGTINWYGSLSAPNPFQSGTSFSTGSISNDVTYYVSDYTSKTTQKAGMTSNSGGGGYYTNPAFLMFDANRPFELVSAVVYAGAAGNRTFQLQNNLGQAVATKTVNLVSGQQRINLNFIVPAGKNYRIGVFSGTVNLYRNNGGVNFPYSDAQNRVRIFQGSATGLGFYYFLYDWEIADLPCESPRVPVSGIVKNCSGTGINENSISELSVYPNPSSNIFNISLFSSETISSNYIITDNSGRVVFEKKLTLLSGENNTSIDLSSFAKGVYHLHITNEKGKTHQKLILH